MKIEAYILCYNEKKMVRHTLAHYSDFCDRIRIFDNESTDGTPDIIKKHFPKVEIESYYSANEINDAVYTEIKNNCWKDSDADWVIVCDMDELLYASGGIRKILEELHHLQVPISKVEGYNMIADHFPTNYNKPITDQVRGGMRAYSFELLEQGLQEPSFDKSIIFCPQRVREINYTIGAHQCFPIKSITLITEPVYEPLKLLHMKYLGREYVKKRWKMYAKRLSQYNKNNRFGAEYTAGDEYVDKCFNMIEEHKIKVV